MNKIIVAAIAAAVMMPAASFAADSSPSVKIGGGIQADYRRGDGNDVTTAQGYGEHEFNLRRARLIVNGKVNDLVGYGVTVQGDNSSNTIFRDMFATLNFNPLAKVTVGQFKYEFDIEGRESSFDRPFMDRTDVTNAVAGGASGAFRDKGAQLSGALDMDGMGGGYAFGVFQGEGISGSDANTGTSTTAFNPSLGRFVTTPNPSSGGNNKFMYTANLFAAPMKGAKINWGYMNDDRTASNTTAPALQNKYAAWTLGAAYDVGPLLARAEYYHGRNDQGSLGEIKGKGWYVMGGYSMLPDLDLLLRYQTLKYTGANTDTNADGVDDNKFHSVDLGAKYYLSKKGRRGGTNVAVNYMIRKAGSDYTSTLLNDGRGRAVTGGNVENVLAARLQVAF